MPSRTHILFTALFAGAMLVPTSAQAQTNRAPAVSAAMPTASCADGRGPTSAFYCAPLVNNESVRACLSNASGNALAQCHQAAAAAFCRAKSYGASAAYQVTASGNLAEVLCRTPTGASAMSPLSGTRRPTVAPAPAAPPAPTPMNFVYATTVESGANPTLTLSGHSGQVTGTFTETRDDAFFDSIYQSGGGTITAGRLEGTFTGDVFTGYWYERQGRTAVQRECDPARGSERIFGRFTLRFSADRKSFSGLHSTCDGAPEDAFFASWKGTLTGQVPAVAAARTSSGGSAATATAPRGSKPKKTRGGDTVADRLARQAADEAERRAGEKVREGVSKALDGLSPF